MILARCSAAHTARKLGRVRKRLSTVALPFDMATGRKKPASPARGRQGERGLTGETGPQGPTGPPGPPMSRTDVLAVVEDQFYEIRKRLDGQLARIAELQAQMEAQHQELQAQHKETALLREQVELVHRLLKKLVGEDS